MAISPSGNSTLGSVLESQHPGARAQGSARSGNFPDFKQLVSEAGRRVETVASSAPDMAPQRPKVELSPIPGPVSDLAEGTGAPRTDTPIATTEPELQDKALSAVRNALAAAGIGPGQVELSYREELVWYPGGSWINHYVTATASDGRTMDFSAKLAERSPQVTATEIDSYLLRDAVIT
ncbi:MAG: hypothetical protein M9913_21585 [Bryobacteraceae bacterium]|nr:hypothetical protein [Solibacteraceae bacterium]MCO5353434.1 hypothetical protein [Bryobacteraceae bacterium]